MTKTETEPIYEEKAAVAAPEKPAPKKFVYIPTAKPAPEKKDEQPKQEFKMPEIYESLKVVHGRLGEGYVSKYKKNRNVISVKFSGGEKMFIITPGDKNNAFEKGFLKVKE